MTDEDALRRAVLLAPADDLPRRVFADGLEDAGDTERAEFIRAQLELDRTAPWEPHAVRARHRSPQWIHGQPWRHTLPALGSGAMVDWADEPFRRGFGWRVQIRQLSGFLQMAPHLFDREPVGELSLPAAGREDWDAFANSPWLANIERLRFTTGSGLSEPIRALAASPFATKVESIAFDVSTSPGMSAVVEILLQSPLVKQLKHLEFRLGHDRDGDILQELNACDELRLESLSLSTMGQGAEALAHLAKLPHAEGLKSLSIQHQTATGAAASAIAATLSIFPLRHFALLAGQLTGTDVLGFAERNVRRSLQSLDLSDNILEEMDGLLGYPELRALRLRNCGLDAASLKRLTQAPFWRHLVELDLRGNGLDDASAAILLAAPLPPNLAALALPASGFSDGVMETLRGQFGEALVARHDRNLD